MTFAGTFFDLLPLIAGEQTEASPVSEAVASEFSCCSSLGSACSFSFGQDFLRPRLLVGVLTFSMVLLTEDLVSWQLIGVLMTLPLRLTKGVVDVGFFGSSSSEQADEVSVSGILRGLPLFGVPSPAALAGLPLLRPVETGSVVFLSSGTVIQVISCSSKCDLQSHRTFLPGVATVGLFGCSFS